MLPEELREDLFTREDVQRLPIVIVFATLYAIEEVIDTAGYEIVRKEHDDDL